MISFEVWQKCYKAGSHRITFACGWGTFSKGNHFFHLTALIGQDAGVRTPSCWDEGLLQLGS